MSGERLRREERFAKNEALFREVNERIKELTEQWTATDEPIEFTCECANPDCADRIHVSLGDYEGVRARPHRFIFAPGHLDLEVEDVVGEHDEFWIVDKRGRAGATAAELDPRS